MGSPYLYQSGGGIAGARLATRRPVWMSGVYWYVNSDGGTDSGGTRGQERLRPLATLAQAYTNASAGDAIVLMSDHVETLTGAQTLGKAGLHLLGEGSGSSVPQLTCNGAIAMLDVTAAGVWIENIKFPQSGTAPTARVRIATAGCQVISCAFDSGASDTAPALKFVTGAGQCRVVDTTFTSTATAVASQPSIGLEVANAMSDLELDNVIFSGGDVGWSDFAFKGTAAITRLVGIDCDFLADSNFYVATGSAYKFHNRNASSSARFDFTA